MRKVLTYRQTPLRFHRWSRKRYAAFVSVGHTVTIGHLAAGVSERLLAKNCAVHPSAHLKETVIGWKKRETTEDSDPNAFTIDPLWQLFQSLFHTNILNCAPTAQADVNTLFIHLVARELLVSLYRSLPGFFSYIHFMNHDRRIETTCTCRRYD